MKKKILFYIDTLGKGGLDKVVLDVANHINFDKYDVTVMRRFPGGYYSQFLDERIHTKANMPFVETSSSLYNHFVRVMGDRIPRGMLHKLFIGNKFDIEIACGDSFAARIIGGSHNKKSKKILWEHMDVTLDESTATHFSPKKAQWFFEPFDKIVGVSKDCRDKFILKYGFKDRVSYIYNPMNIEEIEKKSLEFTVDKKVGFNILAIGRLMPQKAFDRLIEVAKKLTDDGYSFHIDILGEGPEEGKLVSLIEKNKLSNVVKLLGYKNNPYPYIKAADMFVCSSIHESYCLAVAESLVLETPVISTKCTGPIELLDGGKYGMLVDNSKEGLVQGIKKMIDDKQLYWKYKQMSKERKNFFDVDSCIKEFEKIFEDKK